LLKILWVCERKVGAMVWKETCPSCKGNRYIRVMTADGAVNTRKCPSCKGEGFKIRLTHGTTKAW
jgi:DnaJ-class molecular chaperone